MPRRGTLLFSTLRLHNIYETPTYRGRVCITDHPRVNALLAALTLSITDTIPRTNRKRKNNTPCRHPCRLQRGQRATTSQKQLPKKATTNQAWRPSSRAPVPPPPPAAASRNPQVAGAVTQSSSPRRLGPGRRCRRKGRWSVRRGPARPRCRGSSARSSPSSPSTRS